MNLQLRLFTSVEIDTAIIYVVFTTIYSAD